MMNGKNWLTEQLLYASEEVKEWPSWMKELREDRTNIEREPNPKKEIRNMEMENTNRDKLLQSPKQQ